MVQGCIAECCGTQLGTSGDLFRSEAREGNLKKSKTKGSESLARPRITRRELEILRLIAQGNSSKQAAEKLYISKRTVDYHLANVYIKLRVSNRVQAIGAAVRLGLFSNAYEADSLHENRNSVYERAGIELAQMGG